MEKFVVNDGTFFEIQKGAYLGNTCAVVNSFAELETVAGILSKDGNLDKVQFMSDDIAGAQYTNMALEPPMFHSVDVDKDNGKVIAAFALRQVTEEEKQTEENKIQVQTAISYLSDEQELTVKDLFEEWNPEGIAYTAGDRVKYNEKLYKCLQAHTSQSTWDPATALSLWAEILPGQEGTEPGEWKQPESTNPYKKGDKVTHNGKTWESLVDGNVWEPGAQGTEALWKELME